VEALARTGGVAVALERVLAAREQRAARQMAALARYAKPLVSMTVVTPGPIKDGALPRRVLRRALAEIEDIASRVPWPVLSREAFWHETGPEALYVIDAPAALLKLATIALEDLHPLGRLWDLDVIAVGPSTLSRKEFGLAGRRCLVCERPAFECGRSRRHPLHELQQVVQAMVREHDRHQLH